MRRYFPLVAYWISGMHTVLGTMMLADGMPIGAVSLLVAAMMALVGLQRYRMNADVVR